MTKKIIALTLALVMVFALAACGAGSTTTTAPASAAATTETAEAAPAATTAEIVDDTTGLKIPCEPITLSMGCSGTMDGTASGIAIDKYLAELKDWTDGNFVINFYPSGQLGGDAELIEGVQMGSVDIFMGAPSTQIGLIPELAILDISGLYENIDQCNAVLGGGLLDIPGPLLQKRQPAPADLLCHQLPHYLLQQAPGLHGCSEGSEDPHPGEQVPHGVLEGPGRQPHPPGFR